jgi:thymidylate synthase (FAD)
MILVKPSVVIEDLDVPSRIMRKIEQIGRVCYKSEDRITSDSSSKFCKMLLSKKHESVLEHVSATVRFIIDRGVSHELVRHRLCAFSQESTRYCNYKGGVTFIIPLWTNLYPGEFLSETILTNWKTYLKEPKLLWLLSMARAEREYLDLLKFEWTPQQARSVLPNSLKTEIVATTNLREWRHILRLRTDKTAHPQMREVMVPLLQQFQDSLPALFGDLAPVADNNG